MISEDQLLDKLSTTNILTPLVFKALNQAKSSHLTQKRDSGLPVLEDHIYPIAYSIISHYPKSNDLETLISLGLLHDSIEDDVLFTYEKCLEEFDIEFANNLKILTKETSFCRDNQCYKKDEILNQMIKYINNGKYLEGVFKAPEICRIVKLEDRLNNLSDIVKIGSNLKRLRYVIESEYMFIPLAKTVDSFDYKTLLKNELSRLCAYS